MHDPVLHSVVEAAVAATGAATGWLVAPDGDETFRVVAAAGDDASPLRGLEVTGGSAAFVLGSGQPLALTSRGADARLAEGVAAQLAAAPTSLLAVPCGDEDVLGVLELTGKRGGAAFSFDDVELATLLAGIAGAALANRDASVSTPSPGELATDLKRLSSADPRRYATVAGLVSSLLAHG